MSKKETNVPGIIDNVEATCSKNGSNERSTESICYIYTGTSR